jgi:hypothetical protein
MTRIQSFFLLTLSLSVALSSETSPRIDSLTSFPSFKIDLDLDPKERFKESALFFKEPILKVFNAYMKIIPDKVEDFFGRMSPLIKSHQQEHYEEIEGISDALELGLT